MDDIHDRIDAMMTALTTKGYENPWLAVDVYPGGCAVRVFGGKPPSQETEINRLWGCKGPRLSTCLTEAALFIDGLPAMEWANA